MEQGFSFSTIAGSEREASLSMYEVWLGTQKGKIEEGLADPQRLQQCSQDMRGALAGFFQNEYALPQDNIAVFSGRSAPLHRFIFEQAFKQASQDANLFKPEFVYFDDWQNQHLYINRESTTPNFQNSPDPFLVMAQLHERGANIAIHEDHTRLGGKHTFLIEHWKKGLIDQIYQYSAPVFPDHHWIRDFHFALRDEWYNRFFSGFSKLYSQREFYKTHGFMEVLDKHRSHILTSDSSQFRQAMATLHEASGHLEQALLL